MNLHSAVWILAAISLALTIASGVTNPSKVPLWIPLLLLCVAVILGATS